MSTLAVHRFTPGLATFGQAMPRGRVLESARFAVGGDANQTQTDVKLRWPDGSIRFAVVTARITTDGDHVLSQSTAQPGAPVARFLPPVGVWASLPDGRTIYSGPDKGRRDDDWLSGPLCTETRYWAPFYVWDDVAPYEQHAEYPAPLRCAFDVRCYHDGSYWVSCAVENTMDHPDAGGESYASLQVWDGDRLLHEWPDVFHPYLTRCRFMVASHDHQSADVAPDFEPLYQSGLLERYAAGIAARDYGLGFPPFHSGHLLAEMWDCGGREELSPIPGWQARCLANPANVVLRATTLEQGDLSGSWPIHVRGPEGAPRTLDTHPAAWLDGLNRGSWPAGRMHERGNLQPDVSHQPSLAKVPYLLTGERYYAEEMAAWAWYSLFAQYPPSRENGIGSLLGDQQRGIAWGLRNIADAAALLPDGYPGRESLAARVRANLERLDWQVGIGGPLGAMFTDRRPENWGVFAAEGGRFGASGQEEAKAREWLVAVMRARLMKSGGPEDAADEGELIRAASMFIWIAPWEQNYLVWAADHARRLIPTEHGAEFLRSAAGFHLGLFATDSCRPGAEPYTIAVGERSPSHRFYQFFDELYTGPPYAPFESVGSRLALQVAVRLGLPEAGRWLAWVEQQPHCQAALADRPGWNVA